MNHEQRPAASDFEGWEATLINALQKNLKGGGAPLTPLETALDFAVLAWGHGNIHLTADRTESISFAYLGDY